MQASSEEATLRLAKIGRWPDLSYYFGFSYQELADMPRGIIDFYVGELPRLRAETLAMQIDAATYPRLKKEAQKRIARRLERDLKGGLVAEIRRIVASTEEPDEDLSGEDHAKHATAAGIGITLVDAEGRVVADNGAGLEQAAAEEVG